MDHFYYQMPMIQSWDTIHPQTRIKSSQLQLYYEKLMYVSCTCNLLARTCGFRKCIRFRPMLILNLLGLLLNQNLGIIPIYIVVQCFPHDNIV